MLSSVSVTWKERRQELGQATPDAALKNEQNLTFPRTALGGTKQAHKGTALISPGRYTFSPEQRSCTQYLANKLLLSSVTMAVVLSEVFFFL